MKTPVQILSLLLLTLIAPRVEAAHQYIQCAPLDRESWDRSVVALWKDLTRATLFMSSNLETDDNSGIIELREVPPTDKTTDLLVLAGENSIATFMVVLSKKAYWQRSDDLRVALSMSMKDGSFAFSEEQQCFSRLYED